jgi:RNase P/RNase MRP subunit POP5
MVRFKNRYLLVEALSVDPAHGLVDYRPSTPPLTSAILAGQLRSCLGTNFGHLGSALTAQSLSVKYCNATTGIALVRAARDNLEMVWAAVTMMGMWRVIHVAGTIKSAQKAAMRKTVRRLKELKGRLGAGGKRAEVEGMIEKCRNAIKSIEA